MFNFLWGLAKKTELLCDGSVIKEQNGGLSIPWFVSLFWFIRVRGPNDLHFLHNVKLLCVLPRLFNPHSIQLNMLLSETDRTVFSDKRNYVTLFSACVYVCLVKNVIQVVLFPQYRFSVYFSWRKKDYQKILCLNLT